VSRLFGVRVRLVDPAGPIPSELMPQGKLPIINRCDDATYIPRPNYVLGLAGIQAEPAPYWSACTTELLFAVARPLGAVGPLIYQAELYGYQPVDVEFWAGPIGADITEMVVELQRTAVPRGTLEVFFMEAPSGRRVYRRAGVGRIVLRPRDGSGQKLTYRVASCAEISLLLTGLPVGPYEVRFVATAGSLKYPASWQPDAIVTVSETPTEWVVDLAAAGSLELSLMNAKGQVYGGPATLMLMEGTMIVGQSGRGGVLAFGLS